jgi:hypothetical protein
MRNQVELRVLSRSTLRKLVKDQSQHAVSITTPLLGRWKVIGGGRSLVNRAKSSIKLGVLSRSMLGKLVKGR